MDLRYHSTVLFTKDIERSKSFYLRLPGFKVAYDFGKSIGFTNHISLWEIAVNHLISIAGTDDKTTRFELCFGTTDIETVYNEMKQHDVPFLHEIKEESWGQYTIRFYDPDGHLIEIGENLPTFIRRMHKNGMSVEDIHAKSSVSVQDIKTILSKDRL